MIMIQPGTSCSSTNDKVGVHVGHTSVNAHIYLQCISLEN